MVKNYTNKWAAIPVFLYSNGTSNYTILYGKSGEASWINKKITQIHLDDFT